MAAKLERYERACGHLDNFLYDDSEQRIGERRERFLHTSCRSCQQAGKAKAAKKNYQTDRKAWWKSQNRKLRLERNRQLKLLNGRLEELVSQPAPRLVAEMEGTFKKDVYRYAPSAGQLGDVEETTSGTYQVRLYR